MILKVLAGLVAVLVAPATVASRVAEHGPAARSRLAPAFARAGVAYPPRAVTLVGLKREARLEVYAGSRRDAQVFVTSYSILAASGGPGPKLREGDLQVPEGVYGVESLNPNSRFHLALRVSYPNAHDRRRGAADGRRRLGGDIMIHGNAVSIGCLAMGDPVAEELFVLAADTGLAGIAVVLAPHDLRRERAPAGPDLPSWAPQLYTEIAAALAALPDPPVR
jgi:murein L,D-transpeptidase YafK